MKVSVVIPAHNRPELLLEAIHSVTAQTYENWEVIIVDDGSHPAIPIDDIRTRLGCRLICLRNETPKGIPFTKNRGVNAATGEIITLLDDDDLFTSDALEFITHAFSKNRHLDCLFLGVEPFGPYASGPAANRQKAITRVIEASNHTETSDLYLFNSTLFSALLNAVPIDFQRPAIRRGAWNIVGGFDEAQLFSESSWAIRVASIAQCALSKKTVTLWRIHDNNFGWQDHGVDPVKRQIENQVASVKGLLDYFLRQRATLNSRTAMVTRQLADALFDKAYELHAHNKREGLLTLAHSIRYGISIQHLKLLAKYLLPIT